MRVYDLKTAYGLSDHVLDIAFDEVALSVLLEVLDNHRTQVVWLTDDTRQNAKGIQAITNPDGLMRDMETVGFLDTRSDEKCELPEALEKHIHEYGISVINVARAGWIDLLSQAGSKKWKVNVLGLGDVGGTLLTGLRLLGHDVVEQIGIFDLDPKRKRRWMLELSQILDPNVAAYPKIVELEMEALFDCDMFVFCASRSVPEVGSKIKDVRMVQYESNAKIIEPYAKMARNCGFEGVFAVVSDPVDQLCYKVYRSSNEDDAGIFDGLGLRPEQVRGYGLGVMFARASYYADQYGVFFEKGRAFGPHGKELIVANDPQDYDPTVSRQLTKLTVEANLEVREAGYKPFIAPALSSGALSLLNTMRGTWNDSTVMLDGVYIGCRNRLTSEGVEVERHEMSDLLVKKLEDVVEVLKAYV